jgi:CO/xanthine dehydrogenase FAD-binding subunit
VRRCRSVERRLAEGGLPRSPEELDEPLREDVSPIDDLRSTADYRARVLARILFDATRNGRA